MSGILHKKQRIMDFSLTKNGYEQTQNGDLRIKYATFTDKDAIYSIKEKSIDVADEKVMPFMFETYNTDHDIINHEIDLMSRIIDSSYEKGIQINTDDALVKNGNIVSGNLENLNLVFENLSKASIDNINKHCFLLTDNFISFDAITNQNFDIMTKISKINDSENKEKNLNNFSLNVVRNNILQNKYITFSEISPDLSSIDFLKDSRFINKIPYRFLPPSNMNSSIASKNEKIKNVFNLSNDSRDKTKIIYKNIKNPNGIQIENIKNIVQLDSAASIEKIIDDSILNLEILSMSKIKEGNIDKNNSGKILSFEIEFEQIEKDAPFMFQLFENISSDTINKFNKLVMIDHGEMYSANKQKNIQVFSVGRLYNSKQDIAFDENNYITEDDYMFINLFTIVLE